MRNQPAPKLEGLDVIRGSGLLADHSATLEKFAAELVETYQRVQIHRTRTEMEVSVLQDLKHPTPDAKYWQAMREQDVQYTQLVLLGFEYQNLSIKTEKLRRRLVDAVDLDRQTRVELAARPGDHAVGHHRVYIFTGARALGQLNALGKEIHDNKYRFKLRQGFQPDNLRLPRRFLETSTPADQLDEKYFNETLASFKEKMGLNS